MELYSQLVKLVRILQSRWRLSPLGESQASESEAVGNYFDRINIYNHCHHYLCRVFWVMNVACLVMTVSKLTETEDFINPSASLATFLSWFYLLLFLQRYTLTLEIIFLFKMSSKYVILVLILFRFDGVGIYIVMFSEILHTLLRVLMIFSILIVAFGLAFYILLSEVNMF